MHETAYLFKVMWPTVSRIIPTAPDRATGRPYPGYVDSFLLLPALGRLARTWKERKVEPGADFGKTPTRVGIATALTFFLSLVVHLSCHGV